MNEICVAKYLERYPGNFRKYLSEKKHLDKFVKTVMWDYHEIVVYRAIHNVNLVSEDDFLNNIDTAEKFDLTSKPNKSLENFGVSVNEDYKQIEFQLKIPNKKLKLTAIAKGVMSNKYGPASFDEDRPHHNWYLFEKCNEIVSSEFEVEKVYE